MCGVIALCFIQITFKYRIDGSFRHLFPSKNDDIKDVGDGAKYTNLKEFIREIVIKSALQGKVDVFKQSASVLLRCWKISKWTSKLKALKRSFKLLNEVVSSDLTASYTTPLIMSERGKDEEKMFASGFKTN